MNDACAVAGVPMSRRRFLTTGAAAMAVALAPMLPSVAEAAPLPPLRTLDGRELQVVYPHMIGNDVAAVLMLCSREPDALLGINTATVRDDVTERRVRLWAHRQLDRAKRVAFAFAYDDLDA
jgi:hypothetical protein